MAAEGASLMLSLGGQRSPSFCVWSDEELTVCKGGAEMKPVGVGRNGREKITPEPVGSSLRLTSNLRAGNRALAAAWERRRAPGSHRRPRDRGRVRYVHHRNHLDAPTRLCPQASLEA